MGVLTAAPKEFAGPGSLALRHLFRRAFSDDGAASISALWAKINKPVSRFDYIEVVLDNDDGIAFVYQSLQNKQ